MHKWVIIIWHLILHYTDSCGGNFPGGCRVIVHYRSCLLVIFISSKPNVSIKLSDTKYSLFCTCRSSVSWASMFLESFIKLMLRQCLPQIPLSKENAENKSIYIKDERAYFQNICWLIQLHCSLKIFGLVTIITTWSSILRQMDTY